MELEKDTVVVVSVENKFAVSILEHVLVSISDNYQGYISVEIYEEKIELREGDTLIEKGYENVDM